MGQKIGRNDQCYCGSGKKYKKCCGKNEELNFSKYNELGTGTILDEYVYLAQGVMMFAKSLMQFDEEGGKLKEAYDFFEENFRPGEDDGVTVTMSVDWLLFDFRFGKTNETVCERFMKTEHFQNLAGRGQELIRIMAASYDTFYEVTDVSEDIIVFRELYKGKEWRARRINEPYEKDAAAGEIWFTRFMGVPDDAYIYSPPYIYPPETKTQFQKVMKVQKEIFVKEHKKMSLSDEDIFRESCKDVLPNWAKKILGGSFQEPPRGELPPMPKLINTDGDRMMFTKIFFKIIKSEGLAQKLTSMRNFDYDAKNEIWIWFRQGRKKRESFSRNILGTMSVKGGYLECEVNSFRRAEKLVSLLEKRLGGYVKFERTEAKDIDAMPAPTKEEMEKFEQEQKDLYSKPEVRELLRRNQEEYYYKDWLTSRIPALGNKTPLQAVKTEDGRRQVEELISYIERMQNRRQNDMAVKVDFSKIRKKLGLAD